MTEHFEIRWDSFGSHGAKSEGRIGKFSSRSEAEEECLREKGVFDAACGQSPHAETDFNVIRVVTDQFGNRDEY